MSPRRKRLSILLAAGGLCLLAAAAAALFARPRLLEAYTYSTAVYDRQGRLMNIGLSMDEKYRLRTSFAQIPEAAVKALLLYEDRYFYYHPGVNPLRMAKAALLTAVGGRRQGASTITMQLARMVYHIDSSTVSGKIKQILRALQIELFYSKEEILEAYFNLAPYGRNIEGIGAASRIWFGVPPEKLTLRQILTLTVIPQNPSVRSLHRMRGQKEAERAFLRLADVWEETYGGGKKAAELPLQAADNRPLAAPHLVRQLQEKYHGDIFSSIDADFQKMLEDVVSNYLREKENIGIDNAAALIVDRRDMTVLAKVGSAGFFNIGIEGQVDGTRAYRSPGSVMKPFIYALALEEGLIHPLSRLKDVPRNFANYTPENFDRQFYGLIDATASLIKSRNVPAVDLLLAVGEKKYHAFLQKSGVEKLKNAEYYGLALALGGYELTMENVAEMYAALANGGRLRPLRFALQEPETEGRRLLTPEAAFLTMDMLAQNPPPDRKYFPFAKSDDKYRVHWKTGTSFGYRDAWTAGVAGNYVIVVWLGNFDGRGNPSLVGQTAAAPLFFRIVRALAGSTDLGEDVSPTGLNLARVDICRPTGDLADAACADIVEGWFIPGVSKIRLSGISRRVPIDVKTGLRACRHRPPQTVMKSFEFWPSDVLDAYRAAGVAVRRPPAFGEDCDLAATAHLGRAPEIVLPATESVILTGAKDEKLLLRATSDADVSRIFWFYNGRLAASSEPGKTVAVKPEAGAGQIMAVDDKGRFSGKKITVKPALSD